LPPFPTRRSSDLRACRRYPRTVHDVMPRPVQRANPDARPVFAAAGKTTCALAVSPLRIAGRQGARIASTSRLVDVGPAELLVVLGIVLPAGPKRLRLTLGTLGGLESRGC